MCIEYDEERVSPETECPTVATNEATSTADTEFPVNQHRSQNVLNRINYM
ncbi:hypothetical protein ATJ93_3954 [Halopiger aswanensis]|uniref:Uncharacterized protein n=1 Tax=Halopiger aswanensis TaxID=148449 RepID=A0A3R7KJ35_9EURY|nr:hypothetical protein ATJ93_3954 [Halopiger aswanensis]